MTYPSDNFTRNIILLSVKYLTRQPHIRSKINQARSASASNAERTYYFWYGGLLFYIIGFSLIVSSIGGILLSIGVFHWISFGWIVFVFPGWLFYFISNRFSKIAHKSETKISYLVEYSRNNLLVSAFFALAVSSIIVGLLMLPKYVV